MKREIKFKCWLPKLNRMSHVFELSDSHLIFEHGLPDNSVIMQYTGLKDKKGVEIFEGDVVKWIKGTHRVNGEMIDDEKLIEVTIGAGLYCPIQHYISDNNIEVIGNIYETHSLLNDI